MKHVNRIVRPSGEVQLYLRKKGLPSVRLTHPEGSAELQSEVDALVRALSAPKPLAGTVKAALHQYELGPDFTGLAASTKYEYRLILKEFGQDLGDLPVTVMTPAYVKELRDAWAKRGHRAANVRLQLLKNALAGPIISGTIGDPFGRIAQVRRPANAPEPHILWPLVVVETVIRTAIAKRRYGLARAVAIARYAGPRREDVVRIGRNGRVGGRFIFRSGKRKVLVDILEDPELTRWLDETPEAQPLSSWQATRSAAKRRTLTTPTTLVYNMMGRPYSADGVAQELAKLVSTLHRDGCIDSDRYDFHGLRHTRGVELALAGCTDAEGAAQLGHASPSSFAQYRRQADRIRMADNAAEKVIQLRARDSANIAGTIGATDGATEVQRPANLPGARRSEIPYNVGLCDGTALPDRTGDLQSHNLAL